MTDMTDNHEVKKGLKRNFQKLIINYYRQSGREYPWRLTKEPYVVLTTELLLQKTTSKQVLEVHEAFMKRYPNIISLAKADIEELELIIGKLGLRKRAKFLVELANKIKGEYSGQIPDNSLSLLSLKGVGQYTANAVLIFAYDKVVPIVDTNVARVMRRFFSIEGKKPAYADKELWETAEDLVPLNNCREYSYGLLDLAALVCGVTNPLCDNCPLVVHCGYVASQSKERQDPYALL